MHLSPGEAFGRYRIESLLGEGGMGVVYRARDTRLERPVALKLLRADPSGDEVTREKGASRLLHEARAAATLDHPNAVAIHDVGDIEGVPYIAMELVAGRSLRAYVGDASVAVSLRVEWLSDVARALAAAHARGIVHRDVKPENVMLRDDGVIKVLDFGIAWVPGQEPGRPATRSVAPRGHAELPRSTLRSTLSRDGVFVGTPRYMAPEQILGNPVDGRADQFSWGVMAYELLAGCAPWAGETASLTTVHDIVAKAPAPLRTLAPAVPPAVERVVQRALEKEAVDRYPSMEALLQALERTPAARAPQPWRGRYAAATVLGAGALVIGGLVFVGRPRARDPIPTPSSVTGHTPGPVPPEDDDPPHVVLLLDAANGIVRSGSSVSRWADQSGNGNDATGGEQAPTLVSDAIHGLPAVHFDGSWMSIADSPSLHIGTGDFTVEIVARHDRAVLGLANGYGVATGYGRLFGKCEADKPFLGIGMFVNFPHPDPSAKLGTQTSFYHYVDSITDGLNDNRPHLFAAHRVATVLETRVDGVAEATNNAADDNVSAMGRPAYLGAEPREKGLIQQLRGDIAEIVIVHGPMSTQNLEALETELMTKFGVKSMAREHAGRSR